MPIGYVISGPDNGTHMYRGDAEPPRCPGCGFVREPEWIDPGFALPPGRLYDVSFSYDGRLIVSDDFRAAARAFSGGRFLSLSAQRGWHLFLAEAVVAFDTARRRTHIEPVCESCGKPTAVAGATPAFLTGSPLVPDTFFRTDTEFGSGDELAPLIVIGIGIAAELKRHRLKGLELKPIEA